MSSTTPVEAPRLQALSDASRALVESAIDPHHWLSNGPLDAAAILVLAHGAGAAMDSPFMETLAEGVGAAGVRVVRFEFPYMLRKRLDPEASRRPPDRQAVLEATWEGVVATLRQQAPQCRLFIGGKSMGGRIASMLADELHTAGHIEGLVCLGYPFHPPGRPERLRTAHLEPLTTPALIVQGSRDPFGGAEEVPRYPLSKSIRLEWMADGDHSLKPRKSSGRTEADNLAQAVTAVVAFVQEHPA